MALNPNIPLAAAQTESPLLALGRGIQSGQQMAATKQAMSLQKQHAEALQASTQKQITQEDAEQLRAGLQGAFTKMINLPPEQREAYKLQAANEIKSRYGVMLPDEEVANFPTDDRSIQVELMALAGVKSGDFGFGAQETLKDEAGNLFLATMRHDRTSGTVKPVFAPLSGVARPVGQLQKVGQFGLTASEQVTQAGELAGAKRGAELETELAIMPKVRSAIKTAEQEAANKGEALSDLKKAEIAMPGLIKMTDSLMTLADVATYTKTGKIRDALFRELGFEPTKGATARAQMEAIVDNQILPLLRETFGAAFTAAEGERLRGTIMDVDAPPADKKARIQAFLNQKQQQLGEKRAAVEQAQQQNPMEGRTATNAQGQKIIMRNGQWVPL